MDFFDEVGRKLAQTGHGVAQKTKNVAETVKINGLISEEEKRISDTYLRMGKLYYDACGENPGPPFVPLVAAIRDAAAKLAVYTEQLKQIKGVVNCQKCGSEVPYHAPFCSSCGSPVQSSPVSESPADTACPLCGTPLPPGRAFCTNCGKPVEKAGPAETDEGPSDPVSGALRCPVCGKEVPAHTRFCSGCGQRMGG